ncbi:hypothetical protein [Methylocella sp.]|uniref:hypothetical protein n=1 Tax=Methylocella sp. TaxID=1978226 RepID=UPI003784B41C
MTPIDHSGEPALPAPLGEDLSAPGRDGADADAPSGAAPARTETPEGSLRATREEAGAADVEALLPLFAKREEARPDDEARDARHRRFAALVNYGASAGFVLAVLGFAFAAGTYFFGPAQAPDQTAAQVAAREAADLQRRSQASTVALTTEVGALKANVEALRATLAQSLKEQSARDQKSLDGIRTRVDQVKSETAASLAELSGKVEKLQRDPALKQVAERLERIEKQTALPTGSITPMVKAATAERRGAEPKTQAAEAARRPQLITSWVVREVYDGVALVENAHGAIEVGPGDRIPGAGTVRSIERRGGGWIVVTTQGVVDYDHSLAR